MTGRDLALLIIGSFLISAFMMWWSHPDRQPCDNCGKRWCSGHGFSTFVRR